MRDLTEKQRLFAECYYTPGSETFGNGVKSAQKAGYKGSYWTLNQIAIDNIQKPTIKAQKDRLQAENKAIIKHDRENALRLLQQAIDISVSTNNPSGLVAAVREMDVVCGLQHAPAVNKELQEAQKRRSKSNEAMLNDFLQEWSKAKGSPDIKLVKGVG